MNKNTTRYIAISLSALVAFMAVPEKRKNEEAEKVIASVKSLKKILNW
jgi:hypothetical protein